ncbi:DUF1801 domain-containing protein [Roseicyclus sp. F158]|uniref:DUF1801 domain-containing protein n=1 Tax=Tropicimonas omnivorans TaxID=3075590 RepID=A0ABU3DKZ6_9RHOB|nr:DUF1801 domain-containing protein [Roseicyclus sp. F158]MDT0684209.1 DUF1801 domain-containing protein [Roseicyclus sp. F158]
MTALSRPEVDAIDETIRLLIEDIAPDARYAPKYGGDVILPDPDSDDFIGGIFAYAGHVSLEFSHGASFRDPDGHLEGKGKSRRHLKFRERGDVEAKDTRGFLEQALGL